MCGIAGIYAYSASAPSVDRAEVRSIRDHMASRGPDGQGEWFSDDGRLALGHRRLAIIDVSERGAQPMQSADGQLVITFNGEIYNYRELRRQLERLFRQHLDALPSRWYLGLRLQRARRLLRHTHQSVLQIGLACGFASGPHFSNAYRAHFGHTPRDERATWVQAWQQASVDARNQASPDHPGAAV